MHNPFAKPHTLEQWLIGSLCWTLACMGGWVGMASGLFQLHLPGNYAQLVVMSTFWWMHLLVWFRAIASGVGFFRATLAYTSVLDIMGCIWFALLLSFQVFVLVIGALFTLWSLS